MPDFQVFNAPEFITHHPRCHILVVKLGIPVELPEVDDHRRVVLDLDFGQGTVGLHDAVGSGQDETFVDQCPAALNRRRFVVVDPRLPRPVAFPRHVPAD